MGERYDADAGLQYLNARYYDPQLALFLQPDWFEVTEAGVGTNRYAYSLNDPVNLRDPGGNATGVDIFQNFLDLFRGSEAASQRNFDRGVEIQRQIDGLGQSAQNGTLAADAYAALLEKKSERRDYYFGRMGKSKAQLAWDAAKEMGPIALGVAGVRVGKVAKSISNPVPSILARVVPDTPITRVSGTLGKPGASDVFVTGASDIRGLNAKQIAERLTIPESPTGFRVIEFPTPKSGIASPVNRTYPGFIGGGRTAGGASEFVIPNGPIPSGSSTRLVH